MHGETLKNWTSTFEHGTHGHNLNCISSM